MQRFILGLILLVSGSVFAADAPSKMVESVLTQGMQILALKSTDARNQQMCQLVTDTLASEVIGPELLGDYASIATDKAGVAAFYKLVPSFTVSKLIQMAGNAAGSTVDVDPNSVDRGDGTFEVAISIHTAAGKDYDGKAILALMGKTYRLVDAEYFGFSAVQYLADDVQRKLSDASDEDADHPVTVFNKTLTSDANFILCP